MYAFLLALLLVTATVDPRLDEPLQLLAELHDREGQPVGDEFASTPERLGVTLVVAHMAPRAGGYYDADTRTLTIAEALLDEDQRVVAAALVHELQHANDFDLIANGLLENNCVELETRSFEAQARITRAFWRDELPTDSEWERGLTVTTLTFEVRGADGIRELLESDPSYRERCTAS
jgi:hypothetical protein